MTDRNFIFAYGSLMSPESRARTGQTGTAVPVRISGFKRGWNTVIHGLGLTVVGMVPDSSARANGVVVEISEPELRKFDGRELSYERKALTRTRVTMLGSDTILPGIIWVYLTKSVGQPSAQAPIVQSYVDVILSGCLNIGRNFAHEFITTTTGWNTHWLNDRWSPRYALAAPVGSLAPVIDSLLFETIPAAFNKRQES